MPGSPMLPPENLRSGRYALISHYYGVIRGEDRAATGGKFLDWMHSAEGQKCIEQAGNVPL